MKKMDDEKQKNTEIFIKSDIENTDARDMMAEVVNQSDGSSLDLTEQEMEMGAQDISKSWGSLLSPQGIAAYLGLKKLIEKDWMDQDDILFRLRGGGWSLG
jgi:threonine synthase